MPELICGDSRTNMLINHHKLVLIFAAVRWSGNGASGQTIGTKPKRKRAVPSGLHRHDCRKDLYLLRLSRLLDFCPATVGWFLTFAALVHSALGQTKSS